MRIVTGGVLVLLLPFAIAVAYFAAAPEFQRTKSGCGAGGTHFDVRCIEGVPYLEITGLPFPGHFDRVSHPVIPLTGPWRMRADPDDAGLAAAWQDTQQLDASWSEVTVPSTRDAAEGAVWYALRFAPAPGPEAHFPRLGFEGVLLRSAVWLNGTLLGVHQGGGTPFYYDASEALRPGEPNVLVVRADGRLGETTLPPKLSAESMPARAASVGLLRGAALEWIPQSYVFKARARVKLPTPDRAEVSLRVLSSHRGPGSPFTMEVTLRDPAGEVVARDAASDPGATHSGAVELHEFALEVPRPSLYGPGHPALYDLEVALRDDATEHRVALALGLREVRVDGTRLLLNGAPLRLRGVALLEDAPRPGAGRPDDAVDAELDRIAELGANFVRLAPRPAPLRTLARARARGLLVSEEIPFSRVGMSLWFEPGRRGFDRFGMRQLARPELLLAAQQQLIEMIERDANDAAVVLWSVGNEVYDLGDEAGEVIGWLAEVVRVFDDTRPVSVSEVDAPLWLGALRGASQSMDVVSLSLAPDRDPDDVAARLDALHARYPGRPVLVSVPGGGAEASEARPADRIDGILARVAERDWVAGLTAGARADVRRPGSAEMPTGDTRGRLSPDRADSASALAARPARADSAATAGSAR